MFGTEKKFYNTEFNNIICVRVNKDGNLNEWDPAVCNRNKALRFVDPEGNVHLWQQFFLLCLSSPTYLLGITTPMPIADCIATIGCD